MARKISFKQAINEALDLEMRRDPSVIVLGEDTAGGAGAAGERDAWGGPLGVTKGLYPKHGDRVIRRSRSLPILALPSARLPAACARSPN
jgi:pyruvate/2-oxoglutarate/acetoin dehydrogenase E1 component